MGEYEDKIAAVLPHQGRTHPKHAREILWGLGAAFEGFDEQDEALGVVHGITFGRTVSRSARPWGDFMVNIVGKDFVSLFLKETNHSAKINS